uniref:Replication protein A C-terminal domain-containing protein n=1 Tax=Strigamia maritima TaxID=126957 RepID=T1IRF8_STRMM
MWSTFSSASQQGFIKPQETSPGSGLSQNDKPRKIRTQTVVPVTIGHIHDTMNHTDAFKVGEMEINMVSIVGLVVSVEQKTTHIVYIVDDMTGPPINIQHWIDDSCNEADNDKRPMVENTYVQVHGSVKKMRDQLNIIVFKIKPIVDINHLTCHLLEVMHSRKMLEFQLKQMRFAKSEVGNDTAGNEMANVSAMEVDNVIEGVPEGLTKGQATIYKTVHGCQNASGCSVNWLREQLPSMNSALIGQALSFLCDEGHVYTTIDDNHFKVTMQNVSCPTNRSKIA